MHTHAERAARVTAPEDAIEMNEKGEPVINTAKCIGCLRCVKICPAQALEMYFTPEERNILAEWLKQRLLSRCWGK